MPFFWLLRPDFPSLRLLWKEKYLEICAQSSTVPTTLPPTQSGFLNSTDGFYNNMSAAFALVGHPQPQLITNIPNSSTLFNAEKKRFECKECKATFHIFSDLQAHIDKKKCIKYTFQCPQCRYTGFRFMVSPRVLSPLLYNGGRPFSRLLIHSSLST